MPLWYVSEVARQTAEVLQASHRVGIIHRDVKPSNIIGLNLDFKLTDFGLAISVQSRRRPRQRGPDVRRRGDFQHGTRLNRPRSPAATATARPRPIGATS